MSRQYYFEDTLTSYITAPIWRATWLIKIKVQFKSIAHMSLVLKFIVANLNKFTVSYTRERIITAYNMTSYHTDPEEMANFSSKIQIYSTGRIMLHYRAINDFIKISVSNFDFVAGLLVEPCRSLKIDAPMKGALEVAQTSPFQLITTNCEEIKNIKEFLNTIIQSESNKLLCRDQIE